MFNQLAQIFGKRSKRNRISKVRNLTARTPNTFIRKEPAPFNFSGDFPFVASSLSAYKYTHNTLTWILFPTYITTNNKIQHTFFNKIIKHTPIILLFYFFTRHFVLPSQLEPWFHKPSHTMLAKPKPCPSS